MSHELNAAASRVWGLLLSDREDEIEESDLLAIEREAAAPAHKHDPDTCNDCFDMITEEMTVSD